MKTLTEYILENIEDSTVNEAKVKLSNPVENKLYTAFNKLVSSASNRVSTNSIAVPIKSREDFTDKKLLSFQKNADNSGLAWSMSVEDSMDKNLEYAAKYEKQIKELSDKPLVIVHIIEYDSTKYKRVIFFDENSEFTNPADDKKYNGIFVYNRQVGVEENKDLKNILMLNKKNKFDSSKITDYSTVVFEVSKEFIKSIEESYVNICTKLD